MESLLTLSIGEYSAVESILRLTVALMLMTAALLALASFSIPSRLRLPLTLAAVALGGAAWFEYGVWQAWKEAFELAGTSYAVTGHLLADSDRIIAWSLGVPAILFSFGLVQIPWGKAGNSRLEKLAIAVPILALTMPFSMTAGIITLSLVGLLSHVRIAQMLSSNLAFASITLGLLVSLIGSHYSFGSGASGELIRGEIIRSIIDIFSFVIPASLLLIGVLRLSSQEKEKGE
jgi:hypothetical protein